MARRIELPSADVLFGEGQGGARTPPASKAKEAPRPGGPKKGAKANRLKAASKPAGASKAPKSSRPKSGPKSSRPRTAPKSGGPKAAPKPSDRPTKAPKPSPRPKSAAKRTATSPRKAPAARPPQPRRGTPEARLAGIESRLPALPVDALIDLRDGLEDLLAADTLDEAAVRHLLDSVGA